MPDNRFTSAFAMGRNPTEAFDAISNVRVGGPREEMLGCSGAIRHRTDAAQAPGPVAATRGGTATAAALTATLGLAAASWVVAVWQMTGMDMGAATELGSFGFFAALWVSMMVAMMLPGAAPAIVRHLHASGRVRTVPLFVGSYVAVWALVGVVVYALYRPHGSVAAGSLRSRQACTSSRRSSGTSAVAAGRASAPDSSSGSAASARALG